MNKKIFSNSLINSMGYIYTVLITFFLTPFVIHKLGNDLYGIWVLLIGLTGHMGLLDFGMRTAIVKYISEYHSKEDFENLNGIGSTAISLFSFIGCIGWSVIFLLSFFIQDIFNLKTITDINYFLLLFIIGADIFFTFFFMIYQGSLSGIQRYDIIVKNGMFAFSLKSGLTLIVLSFGYSIISLSIVIAVSNLSGFLLNYGKFRKVCSEFKFKIGNLKKKYIRRLWEYSWKSFITNVSDRIIYYSDSMIIGIFLDPKNITFYAIASSLIIYLRQLVLTLGGVFVPAISSADAKKDIKEIHDIVIQGTKVILFVLVPVSCALIVLGSDFIKLWIGEGYDKSYQVLIIIVISQFLVLSQYGLTLALYGLGKHEILAKVNIAIAALNIILSIIFVQFWGVVGVALGAAIPLILLRMLITKRVLDIINLRPIDFTKKIVIPFIILTFLYIISLYCLKFFFGATTWFGFITTVCISVLVFCVLFYFMALNANEKIKINNIVQSKVMSTILLFHNGDNR